MYIKKRKYFNVEILSFFNIHRKKNTREKADTL